MLDPRPGQDSGPYLDPPGLGYVVGNGAEMGGLRPCSTWWVSSNPPVR